MILKERNYYVNFVFQHFTDIPNFISLIGKEKDNNKKANYLRLLIYFAISLILSVSSFLYIIKFYY